MSANNLSSYFQCNWFWNGQNTKRTRKMHLTLALDLVTRPKGLLINNNNKCMFTWLSQCVLSSYSATRPGLAYCPVFWSAWFESSGKANEPHRQEYQYRIQWCAHLGTNNLNKRKHYKKILSRVKAKEIYALWNEVITLGLLYVYMHADINDLKQN